jgi:hypothetical protein
MPEEIVMSAGGRKIEARTGVWSNVKFIMKSTGLDTTAHGIPNILGNPTWSFKLMWIVCFLASCGVCGYLLARSVNDYLNYEVVTTIQLPSFPPSLSAMST